MQACLASNATKVSFEAKAIFIYNAIFSTAASAQDKLVGINSLHHVRFGVRPQ